MKIYISGPISGLPYDKVEARFERDKRDLAAADFEPVSPLDNGLPPDAPLGGTHEARSRHPRHLRWHIPPNWLGEVKRMPYRGQYSPYPTADKDHNKRNDKNAPK